MSAHKTPDDNIRDSIRVLSEKERKLKNKRNREVPKWVAWAQILLIKILTILGVKNQRDDDKY